MLLEQEKIVTMTQDEFDSLFNETILINCTDDTTFEGKVVEIGIAANPPGEVVSLTIMKGRKTRVIPIFKMLRIEY